MTRSELIAQYNQLINDRLAVLDKYKRLYGVSYRNRYTVPAMVHEAYNHKGCEKAIQDLRYFRRFIRELKNMEE